MSKKDWAVHAVRMGEMKSNRKICRKGLAISGPCSLGCRVLRTVTWHFRQCSWAPAKKEAGNE